MVSNYSVNDCIIINVSTFVDDRGALTVMDTDLPFPVKRIFWIYNVNEDKDRGAHALLDSSEIIIAVHGSFVIDLDDTVNQISILLDSADKGLIIPPGIWFRTHSYKNNGVSLVLAEKVYSRDAYTYNYNEFNYLKTK